MTPEPVYTVLSLSVDIINDRVAIDIFQQIIRWHLFSLFFFVTKSSDQSHVHFMFIVSRFKLNQVHVNIKQ